MSDSIPLQDRIHKDNPIRGCFGCGADNHGGLRIKSHVEGDEVVTRWRAEPHHQAYPGYLNGGIASTLIDCHAAWTAAVFEARDRGADLGASADSLPAGWTKALNVEFLKPTPLDAEIVLRGKVVEKGTRSRTVDCSIYVGDDECVRGRVVMVMT